jgi:serine/threonine-protein kinase
MPRLVPARLLAALRPEARTRLELPADLLNESRRRVRIAAALGAGAYTVFLLFLLSRVVESSVYEHRIDLAHDVLGVVLCGSLLAVAGLRAFSDRAVLRAALATEVLLCTLISVQVSWAGFVRTGHLSPLTWVVPVILLFPLLVPAPPRTVLAISTLCALTMPGGPWLLTALGAIHARTSDLVASLITGGVGVTMAVVASRTVYAAGRQVAAARMVGSYELLDRIGQGGMGEVWKAQHLMLARPAAVKLILPEMLQGPAEERDAALKRFTREAQVTASLCSPHTVDLFDFGTTAEGTLYYAMELLEGMTAEHFVYTYGPLEPRRAVNWLRQACHSLGEAHARDLVHRDIKPANVFLCRYGRDLDFVKILDFGLTRPIAGGGDATLTEPGTRMGSPGYMAPEQVFGLATDPRTDLYALGCVGYFLLAGGKPFEGTTTGELLYQHAQAPPPPLSGRAPRPVPAALEAAIMACLSKDPAQRPASADRLAELLDQSVDGSPWSDADAREWWKRNLEAGKPA